MRERIRKKLNYFWGEIVIPGIICFSPVVIALGLMFITQSEDYTTKCKVVDRYEERNRSINIALSNLTKIPIYTSRDEYKIVVEFENEEYDIEVEEEVYKEIQIGDWVECNVSETYGKITGELLDKKIEFATDQS